MSLCTALMGAFPSCKEGTWFYTVNFYFYETRAEGEVRNQTRNGISQAPRERCLAAQLSEHVVISNGLGS